MALLKRVPALVLSLLLFGGSGAVCAGWAPTPADRMACCVDGNCPMHSRERKGQETAVTQAQADSCCASSEDVPASQTISALGVPSLAVSLDTGLLPPVTVELPARHGAWHSPPLASIGAVPKHVLFSVYLV